jgi:hypothetical protein
VQKWAVRAQPAKVAPFAGGNVGAVLKKSLAIFFQ